VHGRDMVEAARAGDDRHRPAPATAPRPPAPLLPRSPSLWLRLSSLSVSLSVLVALEPWTSWGVRETRETKRGLALSQEIKGYHSPHSTTGCCKYGVPNVQLADCTCLELEKACGRFTTVPVHRIDIRYCSLSLCIVHS
jgi:hypothetical protein